MEIKFSILGLGPRMDEICDRIVDLVTTIVTACGGDLVIEVHELEAESEAEHGS